MIRSMTALLLAVTLSAGIQAQAATANQETYYYSLGEPTITEIPDYGAMVPLAGLVQDCDKNISYNTTFSDEVQTAPAGVVDKVGTVVVVLDQVINIGKKVFDVIRAGTPVVNIKRDTANALPSGLKCWSDLGGWKMPKATSYRVVYKNALGMEVVDFTYKVIFTAGGSADGVGRYITNATILPANVHVAFGFDFDVNVTIPSVFNMGTKANPVAGMQMDINWVIRGKIPVNTVQRTESYYVTGKNEIKSLN